MRLYLSAVAATVVLAGAACTRAISPGLERRPVADVDPAGRLPTGARLDPEGPLVPVGNFPLTVVLSPDRRQALLLLSGWREQGLQVVDRERGKVTQTLQLPAAFLGLAFSPDGRTVYASGGNQDVVYRLDWAAGHATVRDSLLLDALDTAAAPNPVAPGEVRRARTTGRRYPAGVAVSADGTRLYVAENLGDDLAIVDLASGRVVQRLETDRYPYAVAVAPDGVVYVSAWGGRTVSVFEPAAGGQLRPATRIEVGRHPSALLLSRDGSRLFVASGSTDRVAVVDTRARRVLAELRDSVPAVGEGATPQALALSQDGRRLFVAEGDANAVAVFHLGRGLASGPDAPSAGDGALAGRIPTAWYPAGLAVSGDTLLVLNAKGKGSAPNPGLPQPGRSGSAPREYTLGQIEGSLQIVAGVAGPLPEAAAATAYAAELARWSARVARANGWDHAPLPRAGAYPPIEHVVYIIKENRTFDQVLGDLPGADGDTALVFFPRSVSPNHHALAERFGVFDRFFTNAEVSADGHNWSVGAYATDYVQKTVPSNYSGRGRSYDYEGTNRGKPVAGDDDAAEPAPGYLWDAAARAGISFRNYGEFVDDKQSGGTVTYVGNKPFLAANTDAHFAGFDLSIPDQARADEWIRELHAFEQAGSMPALEIMRLPNDHTAGARAGQPSPRAFMADNDLALGRVVEALSRSRFWRTSVIFVLEDDSQNGPDHVDSHRSPVLVISPWSRGGVEHRFANTTDVLATIAEILNLQPLSQYQLYGRPLRDAFRSTPDLRPYVALAPSVPLTEKNPARGAGARESRRLDLRSEDANDDDAFNRILWSAIKGDRPYPGTNRAGALEMKR